MSSQRSANAQTRGFMHDMVGMMIQLKAFDMAMGSIATGFRTFRQTMQSLKIQQYTIPLKAYTSSRGAALNSAAQKLGLPITHGIGVGSQRVPMTRQSGMGFLQRAGRAAWGGMMDYGEDVREAWHSRPTNVQPWVKKKGYGSEWAGQMAGAVAGPGIRATMGLLGTMGKVVSWGLGPVQKMGSFLGNMFQRGAKLNPVLGGMNSIFGSMGGPAGMAAMVAVQVVMQLLSALNPFKDLMQALTDIFGVYGDILGTAFMPLIVKLFDVMLSPAVLDMMFMLAGALLQVVMAFFPLIDIIAPFATLLMMALIIPLQILAPIINLLAIPLGWLALGCTLLNAELQALLGAFNTYVSPTLAGLSLFFYTLGNGWSSTVNDIKGALGTIPTWITSTLINPVIGFFNRVIGSINGWIPGNAYDIPLIAMAAGGMVMGPTPVLAGEAGREMIIPLDDPRAQAEMGQPIIVNIYGNVTENQLDEGIKKVWLAKL